MKKITVMAALLGSFYFANAQVGIGTSSPANSAQLDIVANNKGILIPRVELTDINTFAPVTGTQVESLLVYNTISRNDVTQGYYYWADSKWNRVINKTDLDNVAGYKEGDVIYKEVGGDMVFQYYDENGNWQTINFGDLVAANETKTFFRPIVVGSKTTGYLYFSEQDIQDWLGADDANTVANIPDASATTTIDIVGGVVNNFETILNQTTEYKGNNVTIENIIKEIASQVEGNVIYTQDNGDWVFQYWDGTQYQTINLNDLVVAAESKTVIITVDNKQYYVSETYLGANNGTPPAVVDPADLPAGIFPIDVVGGVINNIEEIFTTNQTIVINEGTTDERTFNNVQEYIEYISQNAMQSGVTRIVLDGNGQASFETWNATSETWVAVANTAFSTIVKDNETPTAIRKNTTGTVAGNNIQITYDYFNEAQPDLAGTPQETIDMNADVLNLINNNETIQNAITNILNAGGNVYFGDHDNNASTPNVLYTIINNVNTPIDITENVMTVINNNTQEIKNILGDTYSTTEITNTGDTWIDGNPIYKGVFAATIAAGTANVSDITLTVPTGATAIGDVIGIKILNNATNTLINTATTDVAVTAGVLNFKVGTGNMYQVLSASDLDIKVIVEYSIEE